MMTNPRMLTVRLFLTLALLLFSFVPAFHHHDDNLSHSDCSYCLASDTHIAPVSIQEKTETIVVVSLLVTSEPSLIATRHVVPAPARAPPTL